MKIFTPMLADSKILIAKIKNAHDQSSQKWLYIKDIDIGDKRANLGLLIYGESPKFKINKNFHIQDFVYRNVRDLQCHGTRGQV